MEKCEWAHHGDPSTLLGFGVGLAEQSWRGEHEKEEPKKLPT